MREIERVADRLFTDSSHEAHLARLVWAKIANDSTFAYKLKELNVPWLIPSWVGRLDDFYSVSQRLDCYHALSVDGSQIYPDRHEGVGCSLINIGLVHLSYGVGCKNVYLDSEPTIFVGDQEDDRLNETPHELVNCRRQELEFIAGLEQSLKIHKFCDGEISFVFLFDGSIIFWHLESKDRTVKLRFLASYLDSLQKLYEAGILTAGYISLTKSKELVNLVRVALTEFAEYFGFEELTKYMDLSIEHMTDAKIVRFFLKPFTRTTIFKNHSAITKHYPQHLHPHFFYLHVGAEIVRIEIPFWIAEDESLVKSVSLMIVDQCCKGDGYPIVLAEAHEQAVVKGPDRDFFYQMIKKVGMSKNHVQKFSQKVRKKRGMRF